MADYEIVRHREVPRTDRLSNFVQFHVITYFVGEHGPFVLEIPAKEFTAEKVDQVLSAKAAEIKKLGGG